MNARSKIGGVPPNPMLIIRMMAGIHVNLRLHNLCKRASEIRDRRMFIGDLMTSAFIVDFDKIRHHSPSWSPYNLDEFFFKDTLTKDGSHHGVV